MDKNNTANKESKTDDQVKTNDTKTPHNSSITSLTSIETEEGENNETAKLTQTNLLLQKLQEQVEFYFGDANISKDRFLKNKISENPEGYIPVQIIANFNKMKSLTSDISLITKAMDNSPLLELSTDHELVRRATPIPTFSEEQVNARTIYVENLSPKITHKKLSTLFSCFGIVTYVSLPRFKTSNVVKGFAFIEFSTPQEADKAVQFFKPPSQENNKDELINEQTCEDNVFLSNKTDTNNDKELIADTSHNDQTATDTHSHKGPITNEEPITDQTTTECPSTSNTLHTTHNEATNKQMSVLKRKREDEQIDDISEESLVKRKREETTNNEQMLTLKRKREEEKEESDSKKLKQDNNDTILSEGNTTNDELHFMRLDSTWSELSVVEDDEGEKKGEGKEEIKKKKKVRKRKKRRISVAQHLKTMKLKVLSKKEWLEMKVLFKQMQKEQMKTLKKENKKQAHHHGTTDSTHKGLIINCLVKVKVDDDTITADQLKDACCVYGPVAYVDFTQGHTNGYIRFSQSGCVSKLVDSSHSLNGVTFDSVNEEEEKDYFIKTQTARKQHYLNKRKRKTTRGQDKVISKALQRTATTKPSKSTHIRFSEGEEETVTIINSEL